MKVSVLGLLIALSAQADSQDPLFARMLGEWSGHGSRVNSLSQKKTEITARVTDTLEVVNGAEAIHSKNDLTETGAQPRSYQTNYWIEPSAPAGTYLLSSTPGAKASAQGVFGADGIFRVTQDLGSEYVIRSETTFDQDQTIYRESFTHAGKSQSETEIVYERVR